MNVTLFIILSIILLVIEIRAFFKQNKSVYEYTKLIKELKDNDEDQKTIDQLIKLAECSLKAWYIIGMIIVTPFVAFGKKSNVLKPSENDSEVNVVLRRKYMNVVVKNLFFTSPTLMSILFLEFALLFVFYNLISLFLRSVTFISSFDEFRLKLHNNKISI